MGLMDMTRQWTHRRRGPQAAQDEGRRCRRLWEAPEGAARRTRRSRGWEAVGEASGKSAGCKMETTVPAPPPRGPPRGSSGVSNSEVLCNGWAMPLQPLAPCRFAGDHGYVTKVPV